MAVRTDLFESPDYYQLDELLSEEHLMVRSAVRDYVKKEIYEKIKFFNFKFIPVIFVKTKYYSCIVL